MPATDTSAQAANLTKTPPIPPDGSCAQCGGTRKMPASRLHRAAAVLDPFCSSDCARAWYGVTLPSAAYSTGLGYKATLSSKHMRSARYTPE